MPLYCTLFLAESNRLFILQLAFRVFLLVELTAEIAMLTVTIDL